MATYNEVFDGKGGLLERTTDNGDGTGLYERFTAGQIVETRALTGLPIPQQSARDRLIDALAASPLMLDELADAIRTATTEGVI